MTEQEKNQKYEAEVLAKVTASAEAATKSIIEANAEIKSIPTLSKDLASVTEGLKKAATLEEVKKLSDELQEIGLQVKAYSEKNGTEKKKIGFGELVADALTKQKDEIGNAVKNQTAVRLNLKAAGVMGTSIFATGVLQGLRDPQIDAFERNEQTVLNEIEVINGGPGSNPWSWVEKVVKEGGAAPVAENADKPYYDYTFKENKVSSEVIAAIVAVNKQSLQNMPMLQSDIRGELMADLLEQMQYQILRGDGNSPNLNGILTNAVAFAPNAALADKIQDANEYDVIEAIWAQCYLAHGKPTAVGVHPNMISRMKLNKDLNGQYLMPPFASANGTIVSGMRVVPMWDLNPDEFVGGQLTKYGLNIIEDLTIDIGWINDMFKKNQIAIRAEVSCNGRVKDQHKPKIITGTFTHAKTLLDGAVSS